MESSDSAQALPRLRTVLVSPYRTYHKASEQKGLLEMKFSKQVLIDMARGADEAEHLEIDLHLPNIHSQALSMHDLAPLLLFRQFRTLKFTSMVKSYQKQIWTVAWLNPHLEELTLEAALSPIINNCKHSDWVEIRGDWEPKRLGTLGQCYYGEEAQSELGHGKLIWMHGSGHYLDKLTIEGARLYAGGRAWKPQVVPKQLRIAKLNFAGFVVDAYPFVTYFDPEYLREINFGNHCIDAGFALTEAMLKDVKITRPEQKSLSEEIAQALSNVSVQAGGSNAFTTAAFSTATAIPIAATLPSITTQRLGYGDEDKAGRLTGGGQRQSQLADKGHVEAGGIDEGVSGEQSELVKGKVEKVEEPESEDGLA